jgi:outer membrane protein TolC
MTLMSLTWYDKTALDDLLGVPTEVAYRAQIEATEQIISAEKEQVRITEAQVEADTVPYVNVLSIKSQMAATEATIPQLHQRLSQAEHLLATLAERTPAECAPPLSSGSIFVFRFCSVS